MIEHRVISLYNFDKPVLEVLKINDVKIDETEWKEYSGEIPLDVKINSAEGFSSWDDKSEDYYFLVINQHEFKIGKKEHIDFNKAENNFIIMIDGKEIKSDVEPYLKNDRIMIPFRAIFEELDAEVDYDFSKEEKRVWGIKNNNRVDMIIGEPKASNSRGEIVMDVAPELKDGRTFIPLRFASELLDCKVEWLDEYNVAFIITEDWDYEN